MVRHKQEELLKEGYVSGLRVGNLIINNEWYLSDLELEEEKYIEKGDLIYAWLLIWAEILGRMRSDLIIIFGS
ncbi:MAG: hypothetical protein IPJ86_14995 [Bacteroidetes bacterium]|nr:hypothetical protein [Bacteroidota bacterium]